MRDEKEERKKQARSNKQTRQSNTAHPRQSLLHVHYVSSSPSILELNDDILLHILSCLQLKDRIRLERGYTCTVEYMYIHTMY